jgi:nucleoside-diphosphate-sugar epimerase
VYGEYDSYFISKGLVLARIYQHLKEDFKWLWTKDHKVNTVHIDDVVRAMWAAAEWLIGGNPGWDAAKWGKTPVFNIVDHNNTDQGHMSALSDEIFGIKSDYVGTILSTFARMNLDNVVEDFNDHTMEPWADLLTLNGITRPGPLTPYMEKEWLTDADLCLDGSRFKNVVGFTYQRPAPGKKELLEMIESYRRMNWWPSKD